MAHQPLYTPISFVSPISDTTRRHSSYPTTPLRRLSTYLKNSVTLEPTLVATHRESIISDHGAAERESLRHASIVSVQDIRDDQALREWRRASVEGFWERYGVIGEGGRRGSLMNRDAEGRRGSVGAESERALVGGGKSARRWRRVSWGGGIGRE